MVGEVCGERMHSLLDRQETETEGEKCDQTDPKPIFSHETPPLKFLGPSKNCVTG